MRSKWVILAGALLIACLSARGGASAAESEAVVVRLGLFSNDPVADFNGDGSVNFLDLAIIKQYFFGPPGPSGASSLCGASD